MKIYRCEACHPPCVLQLVDGDYIPDACPFEGPGYGPEWVEQKGDTMDTSARIVACLRTHGKLSGRDIVDRLHIDEAALDAAWQDNAIVRVLPAPGGVAPWYDIPQAGTGARAR